MSAAAWAQLAFLIVLLAISIPLLGGYMAKVYGDGSAPGDRVFLPVERVDLPHLRRVDPEREQRWTVYAFSVLAFSVVGAAAALRDAAAADGAAVQPDARAEGR